MAAKFIGAADPTGETTLKHWIAQGQIQDLVFVFREGVHHRLFISFVSF